MKKIKEERRILHSKLKLSKVRNKKRKKILMMMIRILVS